ncbi:hypothetical protein Avbf_04214 [Armadillidium vulgare]|nr:hypothetical protein Avbf_04214 [Armadillidium vulgare]
MGNVEKVIQISDTIVDIFYLLFMALITLYRLVKAHRSDGSIDAEDLCKKRTDGKDMEKVIFFLYTFFKTCKTKVLIFDMIYGSI